MIKNQRTHIPTKDTPKKKPRYVMIIITLFLSFGVASFYIIEHNLIEKTLYKKIENTTNLEPIEESEIKNDDIIKFAPDYDDIEGCYIDDEMLNPYEQELENEEQLESQDSVTIVNENLLNNINDYRIYLANLNELFIKFFMKTDYSDNLAIIKKLTLPKEIDDIIVMLDSYNDMLATKDKNLEKVSIFSTDAFDRFLTIEKTTDGENKIKKLRNDIKNKILLLNDYMFSPDLQQMFLE